MPERVQVVVPTQGVRKDVADIIQTPEMMRTAINVMVYDGTVRPRPGMNREDIGGVITAWKMIVENHRCIAAFNESLVHQDADGDWYYSIDHGFTWLSLAGKVTGPTWVNKLAYARVAGVLFAFDYAGGLWAADVSSFPTPTDIAFTQIGDYRATYGIAAFIHRADPVFYDHANDVLWWQTRKFGGQGAARVCCLENASIVTTVTFDANFDCGPAKTPTGAGIKLIGCSIGTDTPAAGAGWTTQSEGLRNKFVKWEAGDLESADDQSWFTTNTYFYRLFSKDTGPASTLYALRGSDFSFMTVAMNQYNVFNFPSVALTPTSPESQFRLWGWATDILSQCCVGADNLRTDDNWDTFSQYEDFPGVTNNLYAIHSYETLDYFFVEASTAEGTPQAWFVQGQTGTGVQGDPNIGDGLTLFQASVDTDPSALFLGTTKRLLQFNLSTEVWDDLSPIDLAYEIDGTNDDNRWVFRVTEKGGDRYVLATNGQIAPVAWKTGLDEFRPFGDVDEDGVLGSGETGAPVATCMAISNNRIILGNDLTVYISDPQDFDAGYLTEYKLADTYGSLVSMQELNAITIAILKTDAIYHGISQVEFMGVSAPMRFELIKKGIVGPCSDASVVHLPDGRLCWLGRDGGVYVYDGTVPIDVGRHIRHLISPLLNTDRLGWAHATIDTAKNLLWFFFPIKQPGSIYGMNMGVVLSIDQGSDWPCWMFAFPNTWDIMSAMNVYRETDMTYGQFGELTYGDMPFTAYGDFEGGNWEMFLLRRNLTLFTADWTTARDNGVPISVIMETGWYDMDDIYAFDTIGEMHHVFELDPDDALRFTLYSEQSDGTSLESTDTLRTTSARGRTTYRQTGRRHRFKLSSEVGEVFRWGGATLMYSRRGGR